LSICVGFGPRYPIARDPWADVGNLDLVRQTLLLLDFVWMG
jgi:hypothetical protein